MQSFFVRCRLLACIAGVSVSVAAQEPPPFRGSPAELVVLSVVVTDRRGHDVPDLSRDRFRVYDNNVAQPITWFNNDDAPVSVALLVDLSGSMRPKMGELIIAALAFARTSNPADELFTIAFNEHVLESAERSIAAADTIALEAQLRALNAVGQTALYDGLNAGLDRLETAAHPRKILLLVSDGGDNASAASLDEVLARARRENVAIYTIGLFDAVSSDQNPKVLQSLARATGGERFLPSSPAALLDICQRIAREIRSGYTIAFTPPERDGRYHRVRVDVIPPGDKLIARTRPGYTSATPASDRQK